MSWTELFTEQLTPLALQAGRKTLLQLQHRLEKRSQKSDIQSLAAEWMQLSTELGTERSKFQGIFQMLEAGRASQNETAAVSEALRLLYQGRELADMIRAQSQYLDSSAIEDECDRRRHLCTQLLEYCTYCLLQKDFFTLDNLSMTKILTVAQEFTEQEDNLWPLRVSLIKLIGQIALSDSPQSPNIRQWLLEWVFVSKENPWLTVSALEAWVKTQAQRHIPPVLRLFLFSTDVQKRQFGQDSVFIQKRAAMISGAFQCWELLAEAVQQTHLAESLQIELVQQLCRSPHTKDHGVLIDIIQDPNRIPRVRAAAAIGGHKSPNKNLQLRLQAVLSPDTPDWIVETVLLGLLESIQKELPPVSLCIALEKKLGDSLRYWQDNTNRRDLINAAAIILRGAEIGKSASLRKSFSEIDMQWVQNTTSRIRIKSGKIASLTPLALARLLSFYAYNGEDYCITCHGFQGWETPPKRGYKIQKGWRKSTHLWRILYELSHPRPDKRQGFPHITDTSPVGHIAILSDRLSEVTPTAVPGQRSATPDTVDWRPELPLPSLLLHAATLNTELMVQTPSQAYFVSADGVLPRLQANLNYKYFNTFRYRLLQSEIEDPEPQYDLALKEKGFSVKRLPISLPLISMQNIAQNILTVDANSILHLMTFSIGLLLWWVSHSITQRFRLRKWRQSIPLVIGGWGSRGKSGTERLKAAMIHGMGYSLLAKTTGCEAMMVAGIPGSTPQELFLYRPYDKASITEQRMVLKQAAQLNSQVMLWECMALNPRYVDILQNDWMKDDYTTITNTYPDHEDIQGPTGRDVAQTISCFIPYLGRLISTEQHMSPVIRKVAKERNTHLTEQSVLEWRLLPRDMLDTLPYDEHPRNVALVMGLADELGIPRDQAMWSFGQFVIPDIGVLKEYGPIEIDGKHLSFVNGMSANERAGFLSNWVRADFDQPPNPNDKRFRIVVFNNRADRLPRQSIFASIAAMDTSVNIMVVIGTNVGPFKDEWEKTLDRELTPYLLDLPEERLADIFAKRLHIHPSLHASLQEDVEAIGLQIRSLDTVTSSQEYDESRHQLLQHWLKLLKLKKGWSEQTAIQTFLMALKQQFLTIENPNILGDSLIQKLCDLSPQNSKIRILGSENIKGTGMDFVYRWVSISKTLEYLETLEHRDVIEVKKVLLQLSTHQGYGRYDLKIALESIQEKVQMGYFGTMGLDTEAAGTLSRLRSISSTLRSEKNASLSIWQRIRSGVRYHFDIFDSFKRVREADSISRDLVQRKIGLKRAARESKAIMARQK